LKEWVKRNSWATNAGKNLAYLPILSKIGVLRVVACFEFLAVLVLVGIFVVGIVHWHEPFLDGIKSATKGSNSVDTEIVGIADPSKNIETGVSPRQGRGCVRIHRRRQAEKMGHRLSGKEPNIALIPKLAFIGTLHGQSFRYIDLAIDFLDTCGGAARIYDVKLARAEGTFFYAIRNAINRSGCSQLRKIEIADINPWPLREDQFSLNGPDRFPSSPKPRYANYDEWPVSIEGSPKPTVARLFRIAWTILFWCGCWLAYSRDGFWWGLLSFLLLMLGGSGLVVEWANQHQHSEDQPSFHDGNNVPRKYILTSVNYRGTVIAIGRTQMANILPMERQIAVISALAEGSGIRQAERMTGVNRETIMKLGVRVGKGCALLLDRKMRDLPCRQLQFDEIWGFIGKKERHVRPDDDPTMGDVWTFCAIDPETKLVPAFKCGKRDAATANAFVADIASRMANRIQISSDALGAYRDAIENAFGSEVDFAQIIKTYTHDYSIAPEIKFSAPEVVTTEKRRITGFPNMRLASTSHIERLNGTTRLHMRRLTRLTYAFSKKRENFEAATALHFAYYNFVKRHNSLRVTPAMEAGIERDFWTVADLVERAA
jgi:IS1 family transposase